MVYDFSADLLRGTVTSIMNALLLFVLAKPKYSKRVTICVMASVFLVDILISVYFYCKNDYTSLAKFDILLFVGLIVFLKPFVRDGIFQWIFNCITAMNIIFIIVFLSYHLCDFFPYPYYSNSFLRLFFYALIIMLFQKFVSPLYQQVMENWKVYFLLVLSMFLNFMYYIVSSDDIEEMLTYQWIPLLLLTFMCLLIYITIFYFQQKSITHCFIREEKQRYEELAYMDTLTGVRNRNGYEDYISNLLKMSYDNFCIGIYDVNNLKLANDSLGHEVGDKLISEASRIICKAFKNSAIFRIGGDEFVSVSINVSENEIEMQHDDMLCLLEEYNRISPYTIDLEVAFGYAFQGAPVSVDELFSKADSNMYANKVSMKNTKIGTNLELLDIVDEYGIPSGKTVLRKVAHRNGIRHRTSHVWLLRMHNGKVQVLLQKRSLNKDSFPGCYDISSAGHIPAGDGFEKSALRELKEELGVDAETDELIYCGQRQFEFHGTFHGRDFWDNQVSNIYALWCDLEIEKFNIQNLEVDSVLWMDFDLCLDMVRNNKAPNCIWIEELEMINCDYPYQADSLKGGLS